MSDGGTDVSGPNCTEHTFSEFLRGGVGGWGGMGWGVRGEQERDLGYIAMSTVEGLHTAVGHTHTHKYYNRNLIQCNGRTGRGPASCLWVVGKTSQKWSSGCVLKNGEEFIGYDGEGGITACVEPLHRGVRPCSQIPSTCPVARAPWGRRCVAGLVWKCQ